MDIRSAKILFDLNNAFYRDNAASFSASRHTSWPGWNRCLESWSPPENRTARVLDVACGNMRFERYLADRKPSFSFEATAVDSCAIFEDSVPCHTQFSTFDVSKALIDDDLSFDSSGPFDLVVCFGFMHHIPTAELRQRLLGALVGPLSDGGLAIVSFWRFADDDDFHAKACATTEEALLVLSKEGLVLPEEGDYLVGWNAQPHTYRYCHSFSDEDIDVILESLNRAVVKDRFESDGRTGALNTYVVLEKHSA